MYKLFEDMLNAYHKFEIGSNKEYSDFIKCAIAFCKKANGTKNPYKEEEKEAQISIETKENKK